MANIHHHIFGRHRSTSTCMSIPEDKIRHGAQILQRQIFFRQGMSRTRRRLRLKDESADMIQSGEKGLDEPQPCDETNRGETVMKYILLMSSTNAGVSAYHTWSQSDRDTVMQALGTMAKELMETGEFVATEGLAEPKEAKIVRGEKSGLPMTDGIFPESKEFMLGYWIVDVATPER